MQFLYREIHYSLARHKATHKHKTLKKKPTVVQETLKVTIIALYTGLVYAMQVALAFLPNIELVTFMLSIAALVFTWYYVIGMAFIFCLLEMILSGSGVWELTYMVAWPTLVIVTRLLKRSINNHWWIFILVDTVFGLLFGSFDTGMETIVYGKQTAMVYWMNGWVFDAIHGIANGILAFVLYKPIKNLFNTHLKRYLF